LLLSTIAPAAFFIDASGGNKAYADIEVDADARRCPNGQSGA
jgi:hypothetical protein